MDVTAQEIQDKQFHDAWRGYRQEEVDDFLDQISEALDRALRENAALKERNHELGQAVATARDTEEMLKKTLVTAQRAAEEAIASAQAKADAIVAEAEERTRRLGGELEERKRIAEAEIKSSVEAAENESEQKRRQLEERKRMADAEIKSSMEAAEKESEQKRLELEERKRIAEAEIKSSVEAAEKESEQKRRELDKTVERLEAYEGELRLRLKTFLEQQLEALNVLAERQVTRPRGVQAPSADRSGAGGAKVAPYQPSRPTEDEQETPSEAAAAHPEEGHYRRTLRNLFGREEGTAALRPMIGPQDQAAGGDQTIQLGEEDEGVRIIPKGGAGGPGVTPAPSPKEEDGPDQRP